MGLIAVEVRPYNTVVSTVQTRWTGNQLGKMSNLPSLNAISALQTQKGNNLYWMASVATQCRQWQQQRQRWHQSFSHFGFIQLWALGSCTNSSVFHIGVTYSGFSHCPGFLTPIDWVWYPLTQAWYEKKTLSLLHMEKSLSYCHLVQRRLLPCANYITLKLWSSYLHYRSGLVVKALQCSQKLSVKHVEAFYVPRNAVSENKTPPESIAPQIHYIHTRFHSETKYTIGHMTAL